MLCRWDDPQADSATAAEIVEAAAEVAEVGSPLWLVLLEYVVIAGGYLLVAPVSARPTPSLVRSLTVTHARARTSQTQTQRASSIHGARSTWNTSACGNSTWASTWVT